MGILNITRQQVRAYRRRMDKARGDQEKWDKTLAAFQKSNGISQYSAEQIASRGWVYVVERKDLGVD